MTTPDAYTEYLARQRHLWADKGPLWQARQRAERERKDWFRRHGKLALFIGAVIYLLSCVLAAEYALAYDYPPEEYTHTPTVSVHITHQTLGETTQVSPTNISLDPRERLE